MQKLDATLLRLQEEYREGLAKAGPAAARSAPVRVLMRITGDLPSVVAQEFKVLSEYGPVVAGAIELVDLERIAAMDNVVHLEAETSHSLQLNLSVPQINGTLPLDVDLNLSSHSRGHSVSILYANARTSRSGATS